MYRALRGGQVYAIDCRIEGDKLLCKGLFVDVPSLLGCAVKLWDVDNKEFWLEAKLPEEIQENIQKEDHHILEVVGHG